MKIKSKFIAALLPTTYAVSLSNFQRLPSQGISKNCENVYNSEIPFCTQTDFTDLCSSRCITGLYAIAEEVSSACAGTAVTPNTLLGMVLSGEMVNILCPQPKLKLSKTSKVIPDSTIVMEEPDVETTSTQDSFPTSTRAFDPTTLHLTTLISQTPVSGPKLTTLHLTIASSITSTISMVITTPQASMTLPDEEGNTLTRTLTFPTSSKSKPDDNDTDSPTDESGGGSPFDNQNFKSSATSSDKTSLCAMVIVLTWACLLQR